MEVEWLWRLSIQIVPCSAPSSSGSVVEAVDVRPISASFPMVPSDGSIPVASPSSAMVAALVRVVPFAAVVVVVVVASLILLSPDTITIVGGLTSPSLRFDAFLPMKSTSSIRNQNAASAQSSRLAWASTTRRPCRATVPILRDVQDLVQSSLLP